MSRIVTPLPDFLVSIKIRHWLLLDWFGHVIVSSLYQCKRLLHDLEYNLHEIEITTWLAWIFSLDALGIFALIAWLHSLYLHRWFWGLSNLAGLRHIDGTILSWLNICEIPKFKGPVQCAIHPLSVIFDRRVYTYYLPNQHYMCPFCISFYIYAMQSFWMVSFICS